MWSSPPTQQPRRRRRLAGLLAMSLTAEALRLVVPGGVHDAVSPRGCRLETRPHDVPTTAPRGALVGGAPLPGGCIVRLESAVLRPDTDRSDRRTLEREADDRPRQQEHRDDDDDDVHSPTTTWRPPTSTERQSSSSCPGGGGGGSKGPSEFSLNLGRAIDALRHDVPAFFDRELTWDVYAEDVELRDPSGVAIRGLERYKQTFAAIRFFRNVFVDDVDVHFRLRYDDASRRIVVQWYSTWVLKGSNNLRGGPKKNGGGSSLGGFYAAPMEFHVDAVSHFSLNDKGLIYRHDVDRRLIRTDPARAASPAWLQNCAWAGGLSCPGGAGPPGGPPSSPRRPPLGGRRSGPPTGGTTRQVFRRRRDDAGVLRIRTFGLGCVDDVVVECRPPRR
mmetsp:Transcript_10523/g.42539  ORF Transcript_10523/g.42539 Transcript_10523/m.42539 type:complete len:390 (+) Transcript_10523:80-1249(+)